MSAPQAQKLPLNQQHCQQGTPINKLVNTPKENSLEQVQVNLYNLSLGDCYIYILCRLSTRVDMVTPDKDIYAQEEPKAACEQYAQSAAPHWSPNPEGHRV